MELLNCPVERCDFSTYSSDTLAKHKCKPSWWVWCPEYGVEETMTNILDNDAESAAEEWVTTYEQQDSNYAVAAGDEDIRVCVLDDAKRQEVVNKFPNEGIDRSVALYDAAEKFNISGEGFTPSYTITSD